MMLGLGTEGIFSELLRCSRLSSHFSIIASTASIIASELPNVLVLTMSLLVAGEFGQLHNSPMILLQFLSIAAV